MVSGKPFQRLMVLTGIISIVILPLHASHAGCSTVIVGKNASRTGRVLLGHNEDNEGRLVIARHLVPRRMHKPGEFMVLEEGRARVPQVPETAAFFWSETIASWKASFSDCMVNEWGVAIVSDSCWPSKEKQGELFDGGIGYGLRRAVAERAKTAREGVEIATGLIDRYGYFDSGRAYIIADRDEGWVLQVVMGKHYLARRVGDDEVAYIPNYYTVHQVDLGDRKNFLASPDVISYAVRRGWYAPEDRQRFNDFDFKKAYMSPESYDANSEVTDDLSKDYNILRQKHALEILAGREFHYGEVFPFALRPSKPVGLEELKTILRNHYEGTADFMTTSPTAATPHSLCTICMSETQESVIVEFGEDPRLTVLWLTTGRPCTSPYVPWYLGIKKIPAGYEITRPGSDPDDHFKRSPQDYGYDPAKAWWSFLDLQNLAEPQYEIGRLVEELKTRRDAFEEESSRQEASVENKAKSLIQKSPDEAGTLLTEFTEKSAQKARRLAAEVYRRFSDVKIDILADEISRSGPVKEIQVAILGQKSFEAAEVDASSIRFGPGYVRLDNWASGTGRRADINRDGLLDLIMTFRVEDVLRLAAPCNSDLWLTGKTKSGRVFVAEDQILIRE